MSESESEYEDPVAELTREVLTLREQLRELDERNLEMERDIVQRGVKLNCARITLSRATLAFDERLRRHEETVRGSVLRVRPLLSSVREDAGALLHEVSDAPDSQGASAVARIVDRLNEIDSVLDALVAAVQSTEE